MTKLSLLFMFSFLLQKAAEACSGKAASTVNEEYDDNLILLIRCGSPVSSSKRVVSTESLKLYSHTVADNKNYQCVQTLCR